MPRRRSLLIVREYTVFPEIYVSLRRNFNPKKMIIYNTTFHIHQDILDECLAYLKSDYIPKAARSGILRTPRLRRVLQSANEEGESYSVQFHADDIDSLNRWIREEGAALQQALINRYREKIVGFSTLLEEITLPE